MNNAPQKHATDVEESESASALVSLAPTLLIPESETSTQERLDHRTGESAETPMPKPEVDAPEVCDTQSPKTRDPSPQDDDPGASILATAIGESESQMKAGQVQANLDPSGQPSLTPPTLLMSQSEPSPQDGSDHGSSEAQQLNAETSEEQQGHHPQSTPASSSSPTPTMAGTDSKVAGDQGNEDKVSQTLEQELEGLIDEMDLDDDGNDAKNHDDAPNVDSAKDEQTGPPLPTVVKQAIESCKNHHFFQKFLDAHISKRGWAFGAYASALTDLVDFNTFMQSLCENPRMKWLQYFCWQRRSVKGRQSLQKPLLLPGVLRLSPIRARILIWMFQNQIPSKRTKRMWQWNQRTKSMANSSTRMDKLI